MPAIPVLPEELISMILSNLSPKDDIKTIHALRLSNQALCRLATPSLYRSIQVRKPVNGSSMHADHAQTDIQLIEELMENPERAEFVKEITIHPSNARSLKDDVRQAQREHMAKDDNDVTGATMNAVRTEYRADARIAYFLLNCNKLETLRTPIVYYALGKLAVKVLETAASEHLRYRLQPGTTVQPQLFKSLRELYLHPRNHEHSIEDVRTLLCLPVLQKLSIGAVADGRRMYVRTPPSHDGIIRNSNLISLIFDSCMLSGPGLDTVLSTCPNAKELTMRWRPGLWNQHFHNPEACDVLRQRGQNLEMVHYDSTSMYEFKATRIGGKHKAVGTFGSFACLNTKRLAVPKAFFDHLLDYPVEQRIAEAAQLLPRGLRELYVLGVEDDEMAGVEAMVGLDANPGLEKSACVPWHHFTLYEVCGDVHHRSVDYDRVGVFELKTRE